MWFLNNIKGLGNAGMLLLVFCICSAHAQITIYSEAFTYANGTSSAGLWNGVWGSVDVQNNEISARNQNGTAIWMMTSAVNISAYYNVTVSVDARSATGNHNSNSMRFEYSTNWGGSWIQFDYRTGEFSTINVPITVGNITGPALQIRVSFFSVNNGNPSDYYIDNVTFTGYTCTGETEPPVIDCSALGNPIVLNISSGCSVQIPEYRTQVTATDNCSTIDPWNHMTQTPSAYSTVESGNHTLTITATDDAANSASCNTGLQVTDGVNPVLYYCPTNQNVNVNSGIYYLDSGGLPTPSFGEICTGGTITNNKNGTSSLVGEYFSVGTHTITWRALRPSGNYTECSYVLTVTNPNCGTDNENPVFTTCPTNVSTFPNSGSLYLVPDNSLDAEAVDNCVAPTVVHDYNGGGATLDGETFPIGTTTVTWTATDGSGNSEQCSYDVTVAYRSVVTITANDNTASETPTNNGQFTIDLGVTHTQDVTITYSVSGSATPSTDYNSLAGSITINAGNQTGVIDVSGIVDDAQIEGDETVIVTLTSVDNGYNWSTSPATVTIIDNDLLAQTLSASSSSICLNETISLTATVQNPVSCSNIQYYQYSVNGGSTWVDLLNPAGTCTTTHTPTAAGTYLYRYYYYRNSANFGFSNSVAVDVLSVVVQGSLTANGPFCDSGIGKLTWTATGGIGPFTLAYNDGTTNRTQTNVSSGIPFDVYSNPVTSTTNYDLVSVSPSTGCPRTSGFTSGSCTIEVLTAEVDVSAQISSPKCPDLDPDLDFNPNSVSYDAGASEVIFRITRISPAGQSWYFYYQLNITGSVLDSRFIQPEANPTSPVVVNGSYDTYDLTFYIVNEPGQQVTAELNINNVSAGGCSDDTHGIHSAQIIVSSMPAIGQFN